MLFRSTGDRSKTASNNDSQSARSQKLRELPPAQFVLVSASLDKTTARAITAEFPNIRRVDARSLHRTAPAARLRQSFVRVGEHDKLTALVDVLRGRSSSRSASSTRSDSGNAKAAALDNVFGDESFARSASSSSSPVDKTIVFCNTIPSCRAVEHHLANSGFASVGYHGSILPEVRSLLLRVSGSDVTCMRCRLEGRTGASS